MYYIVGGPDAKPIEELVDQLLMSKRPLASNLKFKVYEDKKATIPVVITNMELSEITPYEGSNKASYIMKGTANIRCSSSLTPKRTAVEIKYCANTKNGRVNTP